MKFFAKAGVVGLLLALTVGCANAPGADPDMRASESPSAAKDGKSAREQTSPSPTPNFSIGLISTASGMTAIRPTDVVEVPVTGGQLTKFSAYDAEGQEVPGTIEANSWRPTRPFKPQHKYRFDVEATASDGRTATATAYGLTVNPELVVEIDFLHTHGAGNGMPIWARFDLPVKDQAQRQAIMNAAQVTTVPEQEGSWAWFDQNTMFWRPKEYWLPGSTAHVEIHAAGLPVGDTWVLDDVSADYQFGDLRVLHADIDGHWLTAYRNGEQVASFPASYGKPGDETMTGTKLIMAKEGSIIMDSSTYGRPVDDPDGYRLRVELSQRVTWSGEYIHAAPWADASHGNANVSHGCVGLSNADAQWIWNFTAAGDPVEFTGSTKRVAPGDTIGAWVYSWDEWRAAGDGRLTGLR